MTNIDPLMPLKENPNESPGESEGRFQELVDFLPEIVFEVDSQGKVKFVNKHGLELLGYTQEDVDAGFMALDIMTPEDREKAQINMAKVLAGESPDPVDYFVQKSNGDRFPVIAKSAPIIAEGKIVGIRGFLTDISDRKEMEESLRQSEKRLRNLFDQAGDSIFLSDLVSRKFIDVNESACDRLGYTRAELLKMGYEDISPPEIELDNEGIKRQVLATGGARFESVHRRKDGSTIPVEVSTRLIDFGGRQVAQSFVRDISKRKEAEIKAQASAERFTRIFQSNPAQQSITRLDDGSIVDVSNSWLETLGFEREEVIGKNARQLGIVMDFDKSVRDQLIAKLKSGVPSHSFEGQLKSKNGEIRQYLVSAEIIELYGEDHLLLVSLDFTEQREAEGKIRELNEQLENMVEKRTADLRTSQQRFQDIAESMSDWIWEMDADFRITYMSDNAFGAYGITPEQAIGKTRIELAEEGLWHIDIDAMRRHEMELKKHIPIRGRKVEIGLMSGRSVVLETHGKPFFDEDNNFLGYRGISRDITDQIRAEEQLITALQKAEAASRTKSEFLANMSHELRTPLNAILGFSESLQHQIFGVMANEKQMEYITHIRNSGQHLLDLINDVLDVSTIEAGKLELIETEILLKKVVDTALRMVNMRADLGGVIINNLISDESVIVRYDERRLKQIFVNLLSNAVKFSPAGKTVNVDFKSGPDGSIKVSVVDEGIGMDEDGIAKALEKFGQVNLDPETENEGTGLGLPLVQGLVEAHGGILEIESQLDLGTTVNFSIPKERIVIN